MGLQLNTEEGLSAVPFTATQRWRCPMAQIHQVARGPEKVQLLFALLIGSNAGRDRPRVPFTLEANRADALETTRMVQIEGLERDDGSGDVWNYSGVEITNSQGYEVVGRKVTGIYNTETRTGTFVVQG